MAVIRALTITPGGTFLIRMKTNSNNPTLTPEKTAVIHKLTGTKYRKMKKRMMAPKTRKIVFNVSIELLMGLYYSQSQKTIKA